MDKVKVVKTKDCYDIKVGRIGYATKPNKLGLVMFYPIEGKFPYRICISADCLERV